MTETAKWYEKAGNCGDVVISTRVRLARNLKQYPFPARATDKQREAVEQKVKDALLSGNSILSKEFRFLPLESASEEEAVSLVERHIVSPEFIANAKGRGFLISKDERISIMVNEEDHVRIQVLHEGLALSEAAEMADRIDTLLNESLRFAFDSELGYLTQCPTNLGTGMRASVMLHLPALTENGAMSRISTNLSKLGLVIRGTYGEGSNVIGAMYQLSNQITLGLSEKEAVENLQNITMQLISEERKTRASLSKNINVQDKVGRSAGVLKNARLLSCDEYMKLISNVRFGIAEKLLSGITLEDIHTLTVAVQPATMAAAHGSNLSAGQRDILRADEVRKALKALQ
jgi:protein arginine kinase